MRKIMAPLLAMACVASLGFPAMAAGEVQKLPQSGKARFQVSYIQYADHFVDLDGTNSFGAMEMAGTTRNLDGQPWFDAMSERCTGQYYKVQGKQQGGNGSCLYLDGDGDKVMINWKDGEGGVGTKEVIGGTGKYAGITGQGTYTFTERTQPAENVWAWVVDVDLNFQLKPGT